MRDICTELKDLLVNQDQFEPRSYVGMSGIGHPCTRKLWIDYHEPVQRKLHPKGYLAIHDGHRHEDIMKDWLNKLPNVIVRGGQTAVKDLEGKFRGHLDGLISVDGVEYVWEHKQSNEAKFDRFQKQTLAEWDGIYYAQAQCYMHYTGIHKHLLTCGTPGLRDFDYKITDFVGAQKYIDKADYITGSRIEPDGLRKGHYMCNWCDHKERCWG